MKSNDFRTELKQFVSFVASDKSTWHLIFFGGGHGGE